MTTVKTAPPIVPIIDQLRALIEEARKRKLWIVSRSIHYGIVWFSPDELAAQNEKGEFIWHPDNFAIDDPRDHMRGLKDRADEAKKEHESFRLRVAQDFVEQVLKD